ncbi:hypothetical protein HDU84_007145, partial [Entophlyctis sp. JEL0112]
MGLAAAIYSDLERNLEKKKATQREMAEFEKAQLKERAEMKREAAVKKMTEDRASGRIPGAYCAQTAEKADRKKQTLKYAAELSGQIAEIKAFKQASGEENKLLGISPEDEKHQFWYQDERKHEARRIKPPSNFDHVRNVPWKHVFINELLESFQYHQPLSETSPSQLSKEASSGDKVSNSLPMKNRAKIADARRQKTDVVQRIEPGPTNRLHDPAKDDPNEPAYFHFGRPGNGAPILDAATRSTVDA